MIVGLRVQITSIWVYKVKCRIQALLGVIGLIVYAGTGRIHLMVIPNIMIISKHAVF